MTRSMFIKNESYNDVMQALSKADTEEEYRHLISERLKGNGWTKEAELKFREHCEVIHYRLPSKDKQKETVGGHSVKRTSPRPVIAGLERSSDFDQVYGPKLEG